MLQLRKIIADIRFNKTRTMLTVLTIAIGVFMVGVISRSWQILSREITNSFASINPHHGVIFTVQPFDEDLVEAIERLPEVKAAEGRRTEYLSVQVGPDTWRSMELVTIADFNDLRVNKISSIHGSWPPPTDSILLEQSSLSLLPDIIGDSTDPSSIESVSPSILVEQRTGKQHNLTVAGFASDLSLYPSDFSKVAYGYITP
ncbi:MAG: ABC transporter permease [Chloroflexota bacterium]